MTSRSIEPDQRGGGVLSEWEPNGYFRVGEFLSHGDCRRFIEAAQHLVRQGQGAIIRYEGNLAEALPKERRVSKLYRFHRAEPETLDSITAEAL
jgi:hypothetical protein